MPESRTRVRLVLAGFPRPVPQYDVWLGGTFAGRVDLAWPDAKVALEYDGVHHAEYGQFTRDRARLNRLVEAGWTVLHMTAPDLREPLLWDAVLAHLRAALAGGH
jgi:very-short-patch-repair endonuclease